MLNSTEETLRPLVCIESSAGTRIMNKQGRMLKLENISVLTPEYLRKFNKHGYILYSITNEVV